MHVERLNQQIKVMEEKVKQCKEEKLLLEAKVYKAHARLDKLIKESNLDAYPQMSLFCI